MTEEEASPVQEQRGEFDFSIPPGESSSENWDTESIGNAVKIAEQEADIPRFRMDKVEFHPSGECNLKCDFCFGLKIAPEMRKTLPRNTMK